MSRRVVINHTCPFCEKHVHYWANCAPTTNPDYYDYAWLLTKRGTKQFFHKSCYMQNTIGAKLQRGEDV